VDRAAFGRPPAYFTLGVETPSYASYGNAGVMLLNLDGLRATYVGFLEWIFSEANLARGLHFGADGPGDQGAYAAYYRGQFDVINWPTFNWRPYWPYAPAAASILHFHGPKAADYAAFLATGTSPSSLYTGVLSRCDGRPELAQPGYPLGRPPRGPPKHCAQWVALYACAPRDLASPRRPPPTPACVALERTVAARRAARATGAPLAALAVVAACVALYARRRAARPRTVSDSTQVSKAL